MDKNTQPQGRGPKEISIEELKKRHGFHEFIGVSDALRYQLEQIVRLARSNCNVLITGESGSGKGMCAEAIQRHSDRADQPFEKRNCSGISEELFESELFGHEKGAFTGA